MLEYVVVKGNVDKFGRIWDMRPYDLCEYCGQPDNCGDCNHNKLSIEDAKEIGCIGVKLN